MVIVAGAAVDGDINTMLTTVTGWFGSSSNVFSFVLVLLLFSLSIRDEHSSSSLRDVLIPQIIPDEVPNIYISIFEVVRTYFISFPKRAAKGAVRAVFLLLVYAKERRGHDARNRGFGLASCPRGVVFLRGTLQAQRAEDWCFQRGTLQTQMPNEATDGLAPSLLDSFSGAAR